MIKTPLKYSPHLFRQLVLPPIIIIIIAITCLPTRTFAKRFCKCDTLPPSTLYIHEQHDWKREPDEDCKKPKGLHPLQNGIVSKR